MFITTKVFDPELFGKAVKITGYAVDGDKFDGIYIVNNTNGKYIKLVDRSGLLIDLHMENFEGDDLLKLQVLELPQVAEAKDQAQPITRNVEQRQQRTLKQIGRENAEVEKILQENIDPMKLEHILRRMRQLGYLHWSNNNASGFVQHAIKCGANIAKVKTGVYVYSLEGI